MGPLFKPKKLLEIYGLKPHQKVFISSSGDMFGEWVPDEWINAVLDVVNKRKKDTTYIFLTKNPSRYKEFEFCDKCLLGTTIDGTSATMFNGMKLMQAKYEKAFLFVSFEPLLNKLDQENIELIKYYNWIIIGANSNPGADNTPDEWADEIIKEARKHNVPVWMKDNYRYKEIIKEFRSNHYAKKMEH